MDTSAPRLATAMLALACAAWGLSFPVMKDADRALETALGGPAWLAPCWLVAVRFLAAGALLLPAVAVLGGLTRAVWRDAGLLALPSVLGYFLQVGGMRGVDAGTNAFLTSMYTPLTPLFAWLLLRRPPAARVLAAMPIAVAGVLMLTLLARAATPVTPGLPAAPPVTSSGFHQALVLLGAACWALQILGIDRWARLHPPVAFSCALFLWIGLGGLLATAGGAAAAGVEAAQLARPLQDLAFVRALAVLVVVCTVVAMLLINAFQPALDPSRAALLYTLEPAFAAGFALLLQGESFAGWKLAGCAVLLLANVVVEAPADLLKRARARGVPGD